MIAGALVSLGRTSTTQSFEVENIHQKSSHLQKALSFSLFVVATMRRDFVALCALFFLGCISRGEAGDACTLWPPACSLVPSETFFANGTTIQHVAVGAYAYFNFTVRFSRRMASLCMIYALYTVYTIFLSSCGRGMGLVSVMFECVLSVLGRSDEAVCVAAALLIVSALADPHARTSVCSHLIECHEWRS